MNTMKKQRRLTRLININLVLMVIIPIIYHFLMKKEVLEQLNKVHILIVFVTMLLLGILATISSYKKGKLMEKQEEEENDSLFLRKQSEALEELVERNPDFCKPSSHKLVMEGRKMFLQGARSALKTECTSQIIERELKNLI